MPVQNQSHWLSLVKKMFNEIEDICNGVFLLRELTAATTDKLLSYGELISSRVITAAMNEKGISAEWKDARTFIKTNSNYGQAVVDFKSTNTNINASLNLDGKKVFIVPGFIASDSKNIITTLGRGGSDY